MKISSGVNSRSFADFSGAVLIYIIGGFGLVMLKFRQPGVVSTERSGDEMRLQTRDQINRAGDTCVPLGFLPGVSESKWSGSSKT